MDNLGLGIFIGFISVIIIMLAGVVGYDVARSSAASTGNFSYKNTKYKCEVVK